MKQLILITFLSLLFIQKGFSQESSELRNNIGIKVMPLSMIDYTPRLRFGLEYISNKKLGYSIDFGIGNKFLNQWRLDGMIWGQDYSFYEIRPEIKYLFVNNKNYYFYSALELFYLNMKDILESGHYKKENSNVETTYESARFNKQKYGVHLKGGINLIISERLNFDFYGGFGFAKRTISYTDVLNPVDGTESIFVEWAPKNYLFEGESIIFHMTLGVKIGYTFWIK